MTIWGFTGTREGMTKRQRTALWEILRGKDTLHHGDCVGADGMAVDVAYTVFCHTISHPCNIAEMRANSKSDEVLPEKPPLERNHDIVDECEVLIAAPKSLVEEQRSGTWATIRYARKVGKPVIILEP